MLYSWVLFNVVPRVQLCRWTFIFEVSWDFDEYVSLSVECGSCLESETVG